LKRDKERRKTLVNRRKGRSQVGMKGGIERRKPLDDKIKWVKVYKKG
jgi:hypothetical protein